MIDVRHNINIRERNTFGMDVECAAWIDFNEAADLDEIYGTEWPQPLKAIGEGSNLLFTGDYGGTLLHSRIDGIEASTSGEHVEVRAGSGVKMDSLAAHAAEHGWWGIENLSGIPGTVGAAAVQNIGAYGVEIKDVIREIEVFDTVSRRHTVLSAEECAYGYRTSRLKHGPDKDRYVVTHVRLQLSLAPHPVTSYGNLREKVGAECTPTAIRQAVTALRDAKLPHPAAYGNAGSFFMNPVVSAEHFARLQSEHPGTEIPHYGAGAGVKIPAAWLIDQAGWKGRRIGGAAVWERQPLVIVNLTGEATPADITALRDAITSDVERRYGIALHAEVEEIRWRD